jgi:hypothetical protein
MAGLDHGAATSDRESSESDREAHAAFYGAAGMTAH